MDCENQLPLVIYEEDTSKQKSLSVLEKISCQSSNDLSFAAISLATMDTLHWKTQSQSVHNIMMTTRRQLRVTEEENCRGLVFAKKRIVLNN